MILVRLQGGLGNQMFQYAAARSIAQRNNCPLFIDLSFLNASHDSASFTYRKYQLDLFKVSQDFARPADLKLFFPGPVRLLVNSLTGTGKYKIVTEHHFGFDPDILNTSCNSLLLGYFQSEKYFIDISELIRKDFEFVNQLSGQNQQVASEMQNSMCVSVHVRRGDYVSNQHISQHHPVCSVEYYRAAIEKISERFDQLKIFVFSDDIKWAEANLRFNHPVKFINHNGDQGHLDLRLMTHCKHHVIANSSFSWWGAWLGQFEEKIVVAPGNWFVDPSISTSDLIPSTWIRI